MASMHDSVRFKTTVYAAIELSKKSWVVAIARPDRDRPSIHRIAGGNLADLIGRLRKAAGEKQRIVVCYEAGYDGFWLARSLAKIGIDCRVLDPASIQVNRRARRVKTDRIDSLAASRRQLGSYLGLTPSAYDSGSTTRCQGISKAGNSWARRVLIEVAWLWRKYQPGSPLSHWYARKTADQSPRIRRIMLIALARKLAISLWRYVETGLVPDGAVMAKTTPHMAAAT